MTQAQTIVPNSTGGVAHGPLSGPLKEMVIAAFAGGASAIKLVEQRITSRLSSDAELLRTIPQYLMEQGGKRIRPLLAVMSYRLLTQNDLSTDIVDVAAGIELIHMATLLHDDIIDQSPTRRHQASAFRQFGLTPSLLAGDFLLVRAFGLCAHLDPFIVRATENACVELTEGEILEGTLSSLTPRTFEDYLTIIGKKTASLFALACESGAFLADVSPEEVHKMRQFGYAAGIAFQMVDDILDITANEDLLGKPAGTDLKQKTPSLINILWLESGDSQALDFFAKDQITAEESRDAVRYLINSPIVKEAQRYAQQWADRATSALNSLDTPYVDSGIKTQLTAIVEYTLNRCL